MEPLYVEKEEFNRVVKLMRLRQSLIEQSFKPGLTLAQKLELQSRAKAINFFTPIEDAKL